MSSLLGFRAKLEGFEHVQKFYESGSPVIGTFQHSSSFDLMGLMAYSPLVFKWIAKKSCASLKCFYQPSSLALKIIFFFVFFHGSDVYSHDWLDGLLDRHVRTPEGI